jgi:hypothetical protein
MANTRVTVQLDRERHIEFSNLARYRMTTLERPFGLEELGDRRKAYGALVAWLWAALVPEDAADFAAPEALVPFVPLARFSELVKALADTVKAATDDAEKNAAGSTPKRSRSSS